MKRTRIIFLLASGATLLAACEATLSATDSGTGAVDVGSVDVGSVDASSVDSPGLDAATGDAPRGASSVGVFLASGHVGRTLVSCDDGRSWNHDQTESFVDEMGEPYPAITRCFDPGMDCDHHPGANTGITYGGSWFFRTTGWGPPGRVTRSRNGIVWEPLTERTTFGGLAHNGVSTLIAGARTPQRTTNDGTTWAPSENEAIPGWNVRRTAYVAGPDGSPSGGLFILLGNDGSEVGISSDGVRWRAPTAIDPACGIQSAGIARVGGVIVIAGGQGSVCRSTDEGMTWTLHALPDNAIASSNMLIATTEFMLWTNGAVLRSTDGMTWTRTPTEPSIEVGPVARSPEGTFVAVRGGWAHWYDQQRFYRSTDGVRWETLEVALAPQGHPIRWITWGQVDAAIACHD